MFFTLWFNFFLLCGSLGCSWKQETNTALERVRKSGTVGLACLSQMHCQDSQLCAPHLNTDPKGLSRMCPDGRGDLPNAAWVWEGWPGCTVHGMRLPSQCPLTLRLHLALTPWDKVIGKPETGVLTWEQTVVLVNSYPWHWRSGSALQTLSCLLSIPSQEKQSQPGSPCSGAESIGLRSLRCLHKSPLSRNLSLTISMVESFHL